MKKGLLFFISLFLSLYIIFFSDAEKYFKIIMALILFINVSYAVYLLVKNKNIKNHDIL